MTAGASPGYASAHAQANIRLYASTQWTASSRANRNYAEARLEVLLPPGAAVILVLRRAHVRPVRRHRLQGVVEVLGRAGRVTLPRARRTSGYGDQPGGDHHQQGRRCCHSFLACPPVDGFASPRYGGELFTGDDPRRVYTPARLMINRRSHARNELLSAVSCSFSLSRSRCVRVARSLTEARVISTQARDRRRDRFHDHGSRSTGRWVM